MGIKAIETRYDGHRFRSRLEAKWAVFYNTLGIPYEYETKEGFNLGPGVGWYLPDFWLPEQGVWVEIKPDRPTVSERRKAHTLAVSSGHHVCVFIGGEFKPLYTHPRLGLSGSQAERFPGTEGSPLEGEGPAMWLDCPRCGPLNEAPTIKAPSDLPSGEESLNCKRCASLLLHDTPSLLTAYAAARSARFEHGK